MKISLVIFFREEENDMNLFIVQGILIFLMNLLKIYT